MCATQIILAKYWGKQMNATENQVTKLAGIYDAISEINDIMELRIIPGLETKFAELLPEIEELLEEVRSTIEES